jgi:uncharacterized protein with HEPN domain
MPPEDVVRLRYMTDAATKAVGFAKGHSREDLDQDELLRLALTKLIEIVGEAAKHVSSETRTKLPDVSWSAAARMRDRLIHHYFDINLDALWATITEDLPSLLTVLRQHSNREPNADA